MENQEELKEMVKRQVPFVAMGGSICSYCIIEKSKNIIGLEMPDILTLPDHEKLREMLDEEKADELAVECLSTIAKKVDLDDDNLTYCKISQLENQRTYGSLFVGILLQKIRPDETLTQLKERVVENYHKMGLLDDISEDSEEIKLNADNVAILDDIFFFYTEKEDEDDMDDFDEGSDAGYETGSAIEHFLAKLAIYRCLKNRKYKEIDTFLEDFDAAMENFKADDNFLNKWTKKYQDEIKD